MLDAKVKLTNLNTGQEYLLLVIKMNLKGLLINSVPTPTLQTPVNLELALASDEKHLELTGEIYKIVENPNGSKGTIIRFSNPSPQHLVFIRRFLETHAPRPQQGAVKKRPIAPSGEKTAMVDLNTLSRLTLSSIEEESLSLSSTMDEEAIHAAKPGLAGSTVIANLNDPLIRNATTGRSTRTKLLLGFGTVFVAVLLVIGLFSKPISRYLDNRFGTVPTSESTGFSEKQTSDPPLTKEPSSSKASAHIKIQEHRTFLLVSILSQNPLPTPAISRTLSPRRLYVDFPSPISLPSRNTIPVSRSPLLRIQVRSHEDGIRLVFDLYPVDFPRYEVTSTDTNVDIFLYR